MRTSGLSQREVGDRGVSQNVVPHCITLSSKSCLLGLKGPSLGDYLSYLYKLLRATGLFCLRFLTNSSDFDVMLT